MWSLRRSGAMCGSVATSVQTTWSMVALGSASLSLCWGLEWDGDIGYVFRGDEVHWVADLVEHLVYSEGEAATPCVVVDGKQLWLSEFTSARLQDCDIRIAARAGMRFSIPVLGLQNPLVGSKLFWKVPSLYTELGLSSQKGSMAKWASHGWPRWESWVAIDVSLPPLHMVKGHTSPTGKGSDDMTHLGNLANNGSRLVSSHALVACLVKWGYLPRSKGGVSSDDERGSIKAFLKGLVTTAMASSMVSWTFFVDPDVKWEPPFPPNGQKPSDVAIRDGELVLDRWESSRCGFRQAVIGALRRAGLLQHSRASIADAMGLMANEKNERTMRTLWWFGKQLIWCVGTLVDQHFARKTEGGKAQKLADLSWRKQSQELCRYLSAGRRRLHAPQALHMALDGGTIGKKPVVLGICALPTNEAMVFPPQVPLLWCRRLPPRCVPQTKIPVLQDPGGENTREHGLFSSVLQDFFRVVQELAFVVQGPFPVCLSPLVRHRLGRNIGVRMCVCVRASPGAALLPRRRLAVHTVGRRGGCAASSARLGTPRPSMVGLEAGLP